MELTSDVSAEHLTFSQEKAALTQIQSEIKQNQPLTLSLSEQQVFDNAVATLEQRVEKGEKQMLFHLGLLFFEQGHYQKAFSCFEQSKDFDFQSLYQLSVMLYDGMGIKQDCTLAVDYMKKVALSQSTRARHLVPAAMFNIGRAYFQGYGVGRLADEDEALRWWLMAADDGNPMASIKAQSVLGLFYSRQFYSLDLKKAFFWHSEACGNGSLESQGALGVMYLHGLGVKKDMVSAYVCLKNAAERGNVFASANLVALLYHHKVYTKAADLAARLSGLTDIEAVARHTDCLASYVQKGVAMATFYMARCLHRGLAIQQNLPRARRLYSKSYDLDPVICAKLHSLVLKEVI